MLYVLCHCTRFIFNKSYLSKRFSDCDRSLFTPDSRREVNAIQCKYYMSKYCDEPFVLVNEDGISELIRDSDAENTKTQI